MSLVQQALDPDLLAWLQADPAFSDLHKLFTERAFDPGACVSPEERKRRQKYEESGYVGDTAPHTVAINKMPACTPCRSERVRFFMLEFFHCNTGWMDRLTEKVCAALRGVPKTLIGVNGEDFLSDSFCDTALRYSVIQVMSPGPRTDEVHYGGGVSLLQMGLTIFGARRLVCHFGSEDARAFRQRAGSTYVGNMCAIEHHVEHEPASAECLGSGEQAVEITIMFRSDVFRHGQARKMKCEPTPVDMYHVVNKVVASHLSSDHMVLPEFANVARRWEGRPSPGGAHQGGINTEAARAGKRRRQPRGGSSGNDID